MDSPDLIRLELVALDVDAGAHPREVIAHLAGLVESAGRTNDSAQLIADVTAREGKAPPRPLVRRERAHARLRAASPPGRLLRPRRPRRPRVPHRRPRGR
uniref:hypothetical protein n=1 Tax=Corynebacterium sanguinis TaxID=2594913 RepID=UPI0028682E92|nr:hypothetical protein [Corynebacterium sanguinis]